jgi:hypothetical protein
MKEEKRSPDQRGFGVILFLVRRIRGFPDTRGPDMSGSRI